MDNDLSATDYTFGFDTATTIAVDRAERLRDTGRSHRRIMVLEVMGRHAGWVALYTAIASAADWVLLPERKVDIKAMLLPPQKSPRPRQSGIVITPKPWNYRGRRRKGNNSTSSAHAAENRGLGEQLAGMIEKEPVSKPAPPVIGHIQRGGGPTPFRPDSRHSRRLQGGGHGQGRRVRQDGRAPGKRYAGCFLGRSHRQAQNSDSRMAPASSTFLSKLIR